MKKESEHLKEPKRRKGDLSFIKVHHLLFTILGIMGGIGAFIFTTFATVKYVDISIAGTKDLVVQQHQETKESLDSLRDDISEMRTLILKSLNRKER